MQSREDKFEEIWSTSILMKLGKITASLPDLTSSCQSCPIKALAAVCHSGPWNRPKKIHSLPSSLHSEGSATGPTGQESTSTRWPLEHQYLDSRLARLCGNQQVPPYVVSTSILSDPEMAIVPQNLAKVRMFSPPR